MRFSDSKNVNTLGKKNLNGVSHLKAKNIIYAIKKH